MLYYIGKDVVELSSQYIYSKCSFHVKSPLHLTNPWITRVTIVYLKYAYDEYMSGLMALPGVRTAAVTVRVSLATLNQ